jgi:hypothetical protein
MMVRDLGGAQLELVEVRGGEVEIRVYLPDWAGIAHFPAPIADQAYTEFEAIETPNDLEDLFRPWSDEETWESYQELRRQEGF